MRLTLCILLLCGAGCSLSAQPPHATHVNTLKLHNAEILEDTTWSGPIEIDGSVKIFKSATLTITPGTEISFVRRDNDKDGLGDGTLIVEGQLIAHGTSQQPIRFRSAESNPQPGDWLEIRVDFSKGTALSYCEIRDSAYALHAHFTRATIEDSHIYRNIDGCRLGQGNFVIRRNLIEMNEGKGINFRNSTMLVSDNIIRHNGSGIFLFETDRAPTIERNNIYANTDNLRLGDFFQTNLHIGTNWWGQTDPALVSTSIYDVNQDPTLGRVTVGIAPQWFDFCGPRESLQLSSKFKFATTGFIDAAPQKLDDDLLIASWDGSIRRISRTGELRWQAGFNDVIDAPPLAHGNRIYGQTWGREVYCLDKQTGARLWSFIYPPSPFDDHRQGGLLLTGNQLLIPAWNGNLYALDAATGREIWHFAGQAPLRSTPVLDEDRIYLSGGDGTLWCLNLNGTLLWRDAGTSPLLTPVIRSAHGPVALDRNGTVRAYDRNGAILWQRSLKEECFYAAPIRSDDGLVIATAAGSVWKLDPATGRVIWHQAGLGPVYATPLPVDDRLYIGDNNGTLTAINSVSGNILGRVDLGAAIQGSPTLFADMIALGCRDSALHLIDVETILPAP